jgi:RNA polymerase sigma factor (sigma-70 family)
MHADEFKSRVLPWQPGLYRMASSLLRNREEAEDAVQETFLKLWNHRHTLAAVTSPRAFALRTLRNLCLDKLKAKTHGSYAPEDETIIVADPVAHWQTEVNDAVRAIHALVNRLPEQQRTVFQLRAVEDLSMEEIAEVTGLTVEHLRVILSRARKTLREMYDKQNDHGRANKSSTHS